MAKVVRKTPKTCMIERLVGVAILCPDDVSWVGVL